MSKLKPVTEQSDEELLESVEPGSLKPVYKSNTDVVDFLSFYRIQIGENKVNCRLLYKLYKKWSQDPILPHPFSVQLGELFPFVRYGTGHVFFINKTKDEILIKKAEKKLKTKTYNYFKHFQNYLKRYNIKTGNFYVKDVVLYNLYDKWIYDQGRKVNLISAKRFNEITKAFFKFKKIKKHYWFAIDKKIKEHLNSNLLEMMKK